MKLFQKTSVAVALTVVMIAAAIGIGQVRGSSAPAVPQLKVKRNLHKSRKNGNQHK